MKESVNPILEQVYRDQVVFDSSGKSLPLHSNISSIEAGVLYRAVRQAAPEVSVEIGLGQGVSAIAILQALCDGGAGIHHVIDPFQASFQYAGLEMVKRAGLSSRMIFHEHFPEEIIPALPALQFAFIDGSHLFDLTLVEFVLVDKKLKTGALIGFHDLWMASIQGVLRYILANRAYRVSDFSYYDQTPARPSWRRGIKNSLAALLGKVPNAHRYFTAHVLRPAAFRSLSNLVFLEKTGSDERSWTFHQPF